MKSFMTALAGTALAGATVTAGFVGAESVKAAGPFDKLKKKVKKAEETAQDVDTVISEADRANKTNGRSLLGSSRNSSTRTRKSQSAGGVAGPAPAKYAAATKCTGAAFSNAFVAEDGEYTFSQGLNTEKRSGLINRKPVSANGCTFPAMGVGDVLYLELDKRAYKRGVHVLQCVSYDGSVQLTNSNRPPEGNYKGKDVMLHTGNSTGYTPTATGSNLSRSRQYDKVLASRGKAMVTFTMPFSQTNKGKDFYCQHYNKDTGKSLLAFTYRS